MKPQNTRRLNLFVSATAAALSLVACQKPAQTAAVDPNALPPSALPLNQAPPPGYAAPAPTPSALPAAPAARYAPARTQRYRYVEHASAMNDAFGQSPPDYAVDYQGTRPWVWRAHNGAYRVVEQVPGGERYYYYDAGDSEPYLIRDPQYTYAYDQGRLVEMYDGYGRPLAPDVAAAQASYAGRYLYYARQLYQAALNNRREAAYAANWRARQSVEFAQQQQWRNQQQSDAEWRDWHDQNAGREQADWQDDRSRRQGYGAGTAAAAAGAAGLAGYLLGSQHHDRNGPPDGNGAQQAQAIAQARQQQAQADLVRQQQAIVMAHGGQAQTDQMRQQMAQQEAARQARAAALARQQAIQQQAAQQQVVQQQAARQAQAAALARQQAMQQQAAQQRMLQQQAAALARQQAIQQQAAQQQLARQTQAAALARQQAAQQQVARQVQSSTPARQQQAQTDQKRQQMAQQQAARKDHADKKPPAGDGPRADGNVVPKQ